MSRINDALRRAKLAQKNAPRVPAPSMPVAPAAHAPRRQSDFSSPLLMAVAGVAALAVGLVSLVLLRHGPVDMGSHANALEAAALPVKAREPLPVVTPARAVPSPARTTVAVAALSPVPVPVASTSKPALPRLQGIFYRPDRPTAIVDGRTVQPGSSIGDFQILAIDFDTVTIGHAGQTNILRLSE